MAMGAFLAGVLLSQSSFRHQIEADIEPFRGILLGLLLSRRRRQLSLDVAVVLQNFRLIIGLVLADDGRKALAIYAVARVLRSPPREALDRAVLMAQGGEFAFVLYAAAAGAGVIDASLNANFTAVVVLSHGADADPRPAPATRFCRPRSARSTAWTWPTGSPAAYCPIGFGRRAGREPSASSPATSTSRSSTRTST